MVSLSLFALLALAPPPAPSAFELLDQSHRAYQALTVYTDEGEIAIETAGGDLRLRFETRWTPDVASYVLERLGDESPDRVERPALWALWRSGDDFFLYDGKSDTYRAVASAEAGLIEMLGTDRRVAALVAFELLAGPDAALLAEPLAASVAGLLDCGGRRCWSVDFTPDTPAVRVRVEIDQATRLVRSVEIELDAIDLLTANKYVAAALVEAKKRSRDGDATRIVVRYEPATEPTVAVESWTPPATAQLAAPASSTTGTIDQLAAAGAADAPNRTPGRVFGEEIEVRISTVTVRVIDVAGRAIPDLGPADFKVSVGGEVAAVESVDWIAPSTERFSQEELAELARSGVTVPSPGRLIVFFVQTDLHPTRTPGHLRLLPEIRRLLETFNPDDQVAVVSFDSHLKLRQDFTRDLETVDDAIWRGIRTGREDEMAPGRFPSLARHFDFDAAKRAASPEEALRVVGDALLPLPGEKVMIYTGWGLGAYFAGTVVMTPDYDDAHAALTRARVTVFVLDITRADYHSLEIGLETIAEDTGGTYEKTYRQPRQMTDASRAYARGLLRDRLHGAGDRRRSRQGERRADRPPRHRAAAAAANQRLSLRARRRRTSGLGGRAVAARSPRRGGSAPPAA